MESACFFEYKNVLTPGNNGASVIPKKNLITKSVVLSVASEVHAETPDQTNTVTGRYIAGRTLVNSMFDGS